jgi:hypothetical protein
LEFAELLDEARLVVEMVQSVDFLESLLSRSTVEGALVIASVHAFWKPVGVSTLASLQGNFLMS